MDGPERREWGKGENGMKGGQGERATHQTALNGPRSVRGSGWGGEKGGGGVKITPPDGRKMDGPERDE